MAGHIIKRNYGVANPLEKNKFSAFTPSFISALPLKAGQGVLAKPNNMEFSIKPIGKIYTPYKEKRGVPFQGAFDPKSKGRAEIFKEFEPGLMDLEGFSHLIFLYLFDRAEGYDLVCQPYMEDKLHGVFATRAPKRPNQIGLSVVRLESREGSILHVAEVDMLDGTPLLDIKPFVPAFDHRKNARVGWMKDPLRNPDKKTVSDDRF